MQPELEKELIDHRERLRRMVELRIDARLLCRIDASDVVQEAYIDANHRFAEYLNKREVPIYTWLRFLTYQKLAQMQRTHFGVQARDVRREVSIDQPISVPKASSAAIAARLVGDVDTPSMIVAKREDETRLESLIQDLDELDREIIAMRNIEQLDNVTTAELLGITPEAAYKRYVRALRRIRERLGNASDMNV